MFRLKEEAARCLLCLEGACTAACEKGFDPARAVRAIRFENEAGAGNFIDKGVCSECTGVLHFQYMPFQESDNLP